MHLVGRHHLVRMYDYRGLSASHVFSYGLAQTGAKISRYREEDWCVLPSGTLVPAIRGGSGWAISKSGRILAPAVAYASITSTAVTTALDSAYSFGVSGDGIAGQINNTYDRTLTDVLFHISSFTGTAANVNDIELEVRNNGTGKPGSTLMASGALDPGGATGWHQFTGLSASFTAGGLFWVIISDADGGGTDFANVTMRLAYGDYARGANHAVITTDGWATVVTTQSLASTVVCGFDDGSAVGTATLVATNPANTTLQRGFRHNSGFPGSVKIFGIAAVNNSPPSNSSGVSLFLNDDLPNNATATDTMQIGAGSSASQTSVGRCFSSPPTIPQATPFRLCYTFSANSTGVTKYSAGSTGAGNAFLRAARGNPDLYYALATATPDWGGDDADAIPNATMMIEDTVTVATGGSAGVIGS